MNAATPHCKANHAETLIDRTTLRRIARSMREFAATGTRVVPSLLETWAKEISAVEQSLRGDSA